MAWVSYSVAILLENHGSPIEERPECPNTGQQNQLGSCRYPYLLQLLLGAESLGNNNPGAV